MLAFYLHVGKGILLLVTFVIEAIERLTNVTITEVRVTNDLQIAKVYWTQLGREGHL